MRLLFITGFSRIKLGGLEFVPDGAGYVYLHRMLRADGHAGTLCRR
jgi:hypothetical protein